LNTDGGPRKAREILSKKVINFKKNFIFSFPDNKIYIKGEM